MKEWLFYDVFIANVWKGVHFIAEVVALWDAFCKQKGSVYVKTLGKHNFRTGRAREMWFGMHVGDMWGYKLVHLFVCLTVCKMSLSKMMLLSLQLILVLITLGSCTLLGRVLGGVH